MASDQRAFLVRPSLRIAGAALALLGAALFLMESFDLFEQSNVVGTRCRPGKGRWACELGAWLISLFPESVRGPVLGSTALVITGSMLFLAWLLLAGASPQRTGYRESPGSSTDALQRSFQPLISRRSRLVGRPCVSVRAGSTPWRRCSAAFSRAAMLAGVSS